MSSSLPIYRVRQDGAVEAIGTWDPGARALDLASEGFPLLHAGIHPVEGELPWVFFEMGPSGYLGRRFARAFKHLGLPPDASKWRGEQVLRALSEAGHDLAGNLLVGDESLRRFHHIFRGDRAPGPTRDEAPERFGRFVDDTLGLVEGGSSLGGERPKFSLRLQDHSGWLVKFSPPLDTLVGRRWADLLRTELHAAEALRAHSLEAVQGCVIERDGRAFLVLERFDRLAGGGRRGAVTWYWLGLALHGEYEPAPIARRLLEGGWLSTEDHARFTRAHAFAAAMGNNDAHAGNYGLTLSDDGVHALAPLYDLAPMALAPQHDELPDARLRPWPAASPAVGEIVRDLAARIARDPSISPAFKALWRRGAAASLG